MYQFLYFSVFFINFYINLPLKSIVMKFRQSHLILLAFVLTAGISSSLKSQDKKSELIKGLKVSELLKTGEHHRYTVKLEAGSFAFFRLEQKGIDAGYTIAV